MKKTNRILSLMLAILLVVGMVPTSVITVFAASMTVNVEMPSGETVILDVEPADSIENVKQKMQDKTGLNPETISLYFEDKLLEDGRTLADYNIQSGSTLKLTLLSPEDTGETYTLTIKYAITSSNGVEIGNEIADEQITNISPDTMMDLSDYWPEKMSVVGADGETYYFAGFVENSNGDGVLVYSWRIYGNKTLYAAWTFDSEISISFNTNGGTLDFKAIRYAKKFANIERMNRRFAPVRDGYKFLGWSLDDDGTADEPDIEITEDCTLYAVWGHSHCVCGGNTDIGDHTAHTDAEFTPWNKTDSMPTEAGNYVLMNDVSITETWVPASSVPTTICLNGKTLSYSGSSKDRVILLRGDTERILNICDCSGGSGKITGGTSSGIGVAQTTVLNMYGGMITGNKNGGILIGTGGHFNMYGGAISDNTIAGYSDGAGVQNNGTFIMMGGSITDNKITSANSSGGGVYSASDAIIEISGDAIIKNNIDIDKPSNLHLASNGTTDAKITIGELGSNASIGVSVDSNHGMVISGGGKDYADKFFSDSGAYVIAIDGEDLELLETEVHVGHAVLKNGEYTTDGQSTTTTKPESGGYAHFENGVLTLHNFTYSGGGYYLSAIYCNHALTIKVEGENSITRVVTATDTDTKMALRGIRVEHGKLTIIGDSKDDSLRVVVDGHDDVSASGIYGDTEGIDIYNCTLEARSVNGGKGLNAPGNITITEAKVIGASEAPATSLNNQGIYAGILKVTNSDVIGIADNTSPGRATGIYLDGSKSKLIFESGTIVGEVPDALGNSYAIYIHTNAATLPAKYWMRTSASGEYENGTWDGANVGPYFKLTTTEPHIHSYTRKTNDTQHWMECVCGTVQDGSLEDHKGGTATCQTKAKCSECGEEYGDYGAHNWNADWITDSEKHWHKCLNTGCTEIKDDNLHSGGTATCKDLAKCEFCDTPYGQLLAHSYQWVVDQEPTTSAPGVKHEQCVCGAKRSENTPIPQLASPPTGDSSYVSLFAGLVILSTMGMAAIVVLGKKRRIS